MIRPAATLVLSVWAVGQAAGFDCAKASTPVEKRVCADPGISALDTKLNDEFKQRLKGLGPVSKIALRLDQNAWMREARDEALTDRELKDAYTLRIAQLQQPVVSLFADELVTDADGNGRDVNVITPADSRLPSFRRSGAKQLQGKLTGCELLVDVPVGTAQGNHSFGGYCLLETKGKKMPVLVCDDDMAGHYSLQETDGQPIDVKTLGEFVLRECFGG